MTKPIVFSYISNLVKVSKHANAPLNISIQKTDATLTTLTPFDYLRKRLQRNYVDKMSKFRRMYKEISKVNDILIICITSKRIKRRLHLLKQIWEDKQQELKTYKTEKTCPASETNKEKYHIELVLVHVLHSVISP